MKKAAIYDLTDRGIFHNAEAYIARGGSGEIRALVTALVGEFGAAELRVIDLKRVPFELLQRDDLLRLVFLSGGGDD